MQRNLIICSDGTGNTFRQGMSNVSRLVQALDLAHREEQLVFYDQGIGTNPGLVEDVKRFKQDTGKNRAGLEILDPPRVGLARPLATLAGLAVGYGLYANLREMYQALAKHYEARTDRLFLFGFSRGAFTVRALAGLIHRCGIPARRFAEDDATFDACFSEAYGTYESHAEDRVRIAAFKDTYQSQDLEIHFLGIWDTVKSYGGLRPVSLPHLRFNSSVKSVCHALALKEHRSWFLPTSWGGVDSVTGEAALLQSLAPGQTISEVWFRGCHSDVGGAYDIAKIPFRWMLGEATEAGVLLDAGCEAWIFNDDQGEAGLGINDPYGIGWWWSDRIPRWELDNSTRPPTYAFKWWGKGERNVEAVRRGGYLYAHATAGMSGRPDVKIVETKRRLTREQVRSAG